MDVRVLPSFYCPFNGGLTDITEIMPKANNLVGVEQKKAKLSRRCSNYQG